MTTTPTASPELPDLDKLEALARAATPGPWAYQEDSDVYTHIVRPAQSLGRIVHHYSQDTSGVVEANARFTAGANPAAVLALIALARRAQPEGEARRAEHVNFTPTEQQFADWCERHDVKPHHSREAFDDAVTLYLTAPAATLSPLCGAQQAAAPDALDDLDFTPDAHHQVADMANVGYELMQTIKALRPDYCWNDTPAEIVSDLINELDEATTSAPGTPEAPKQPAHGHRDDYYLLANGRRLGLESIIRVRNMPNWVLAMELFATGSTSAHQICHDAGVDPEGTTIQRAAAPKGGA